MARYLITGCDRGIGLALAHHLSARGDEVIATCLGAGPEGDAGALRVEPHVDVADDRSVAALDDRLGDLRLDVVISNAGVQRKLSLKKLDFASMSRQFEVNALGPLRVVAALRHRLGEGGKIALISSRMGLPGPTRSSGGNYGYRMSKAALNVAGVDHQAPVMRKAVDWLVSIQNADGGWGEDASSYRLDYKGYELAPSTSSQTAWALLALMAVGEANHPAVHRGVAYLTQTQNEAGEWDETRYTATGFPRVFYLRYHGYRKFFPLWALARYRNLHSTNSRLVGVGM